jgi:hypothetical protein
VLDRPRPCRELMKKPSTKTRIDEADHARCRDESASAR